MTGPADNTPWCRVCGMAFQVRGCTPERCADPEAKRAAERRIIDEAVRIATGIGATPETLDAAMRDDLALATEVWHLGPDGKPDFHEVKMSDEKKTPVMEFPDGTDPPVPRPVIRVSAALIADAPAMLGLLRELEWSDDGLCPLCGALVSANVGPMYERHGDAEGAPCRLGALLDKHGRKP